MNSLRCIVLGGLLVAPSVLWAEPSAPAETLTLAQAVDRALQENPEVLTAGEEVVATRWSRASALAAAGPRLRLEGNVLRYDQALNLTFPMPAGLPVSSDPIPLRAQTTASLSATVVQPLTPLWSIFENYRIKDLGVDIAALRKEASRRDIAFQTTEAFYRVLQARRLVEISQVSVKQVSAQVERSRVFEGQGVVSRNDLLRAELGLAAAQQRLIQAQGNYTLAQGRLALVLGMPPSAQLQPVEPLDSDVSAPAPSLEALTEAALSGRPELREVSLRVRQAYAGRRASWSRMVPQLSAMAAYQRNEGSSLMQVETKFVGLSAAWDVWEWGATYGGIREASARVRQAELGEERLRQGIEMDARAAHVTYSTASQALEVAKKSLAQSEENFRLETHRYEANTSTSFDVLDAESLVTQARAQLATALFDSYIARAGMARAAGQLPGAASSSVTKE